jgi:hypothetical protein
VENLKTNYLILISWGNKTFRNSWDPMIIKTPTAEAKKCPIENIIPDIMENFSTMYPAINELKITMTRVYIPKMV